MKTKEESMQECINRASQFFDEIMPQIGRLVSQDYENINELAILLNKFKSEEVIL